jgi:hypothetical protein
MKTKLIGIIICMLLIGTVLPVAGAMNDNETSEIVSAIQGYSAEQVIERGWLEKQKLTASDGSYEDCFGFSVSIDGDYAIVGAWLDDDNGDGSGSAYVFKRDGTTWTEEAKLTASDGAAEDNFGWSVSIDGDYAIVGAWLDDDNGEDSGSAYVFKRDGTTWTEEAKLTASDGAAEDCFGYSVSISGDYAIVGAYNDNGAKGSAYIFVKESENQPPGAPTITGKLKGNPGKSYEYTFNAIDPNGDNVKYYIDWDDGDSDETGLYPSSTDVKVKHTWDSDGTYTIRAYAEDVFGLVGPEATLTVTMPRNRAINGFFLRFLEQFPILQKILLLLQR